jgi:hypothetical protein
MNPIDPSMYPEGLGWSNVQAIGGNPDGSYVTNSGAYFKSAGQRDIGLYIAGTGDNTKALFNTVDGYVYAIPMFMVYRRGVGFLFNPNSVHTSISNISGSLSTVSDRPDGKYADIVYSDDIIDVRHQLVTSGKDLEGILNESFRKLITNELKTSLGQGFTANNQRVVCSGGSTLLKIDQLNGTTSNIPNIGTGCFSPDFKRRAYCNANLVSDHNVYPVPTPVGGVWVVGTIPISSFFSSFIGEIVSIDGLYFVDPAEGSAWVTNCNISDPTQIVIQPGSNILGENYSVFVEFTFNYYAQKGGFYDVPKKFYEVSKNVYQPIATRDQTVPVRFHDNQDLILKSEAIFDYLKYCGGNYTESYEFGHDYVYYLNWNSSTPSIPCAGGKYNGYPILGIKAIQIWNGVAYGNPETFTVIRNVSGSDVTYEITITSTVIVVATDILITLITGSGSTEADSFKFFELSKQGRGIIDIYEMILVTAPAKSVGSYLLDTGDKPIIAIGSYETLNSGYVQGVPFAYDDLGNRLDVKIVPPGGGSLVLQVNNYLPVLNNSDADDNLLPTRIIINTDVGYPYIVVPVLVHSYVTATEAAYSFYYKFNPYQGLLTDSSVEKGKIEKEGKAVITTEGSGAVNNFTFNYGAVTTTQGNRTITQSGAIPWSNYIQAGDYLNIHNSSYFYRILSVNSGAILTLAEPFNEPSVVADYNIVRLDIPENNLANLFDILPTYGYDDFEGKGSKITLGSLTGTAIEVSSKQSDQSPLDTIVNDFQLGLNKPPTSRGRSYFKLSTQDKNTFIKLGILTPHINYGSISPLPLDTGYIKVYQAYLYNETYEDNSGFYRDLTGRIYLLVVSSETNKDTGNIMLNGFSDKDTIDIFELVGRPIIKTI